MQTLNPHFPDSFGVDLANNRFYIGATGYDLQNGKDQGQYQPPAKLPKDCAAFGPTSADGQSIFNLGYKGRAGQVCVLDAGD